jgi:hypothetical protein
MIILIKNQYGPAGTFLHYSGSGISARIPASPSAAGEGGRGFLFGFSRCLRFGRERAARSPSRSGRRSRGLDERAMRQRPERAPEEKAENEPQQAHWPVSVLNRWFQARRPAAFVLEGCAAGAKRDLLNGGCCTITGAGLSVGAVSRAHQLACLRFGRERRSDFGRRRSLRRTALRLSTLGS